MAARPFLHRLTRRVLLALILLATGLFAAGFVAPRASAAGPVTYLPLVLTYGPPAERPTSDQLIAEALARGQIDAETALTYRVFATFGDGRLPTAFKGDDRRVVDSHIVSEVQDRYASLSTATQAVLNPFLIPPIYEGSWASGQPAAVRPASEAPRNTPPACEKLEKGKWSFKDGKNARFWWRTERAKEDEPRADHFIAELDGKIAPALTGLMGNRGPLSDMKNSCNGESPALDIYLDATLGLPIAPSHNKPGCKETPSYIVLNPAHPDSQLAHEFMHTIQWGYKAKAGCVNGEYLWLAEATAQWAMDFVYPKVNYEHASAPRFFPVGVTRSLEATGNDHEYGDYLFFLYLVRSSKNPLLVRTAWDNTERDENNDSLSATNDAIPGGFEEAWPKFALENVNQPPFDLYRREDQLAVEAVSLEPRRSVRGPGRWPMTAEVPHLGLVYQYYYFVQEKPRLVTFFNGLTKTLSEEPMNEFLDTAMINDGTTWYKTADRAAEQIKGTKVQALYKIEGDKEWKNADWTDKPYMSFCRDVKAERLEQLILIMSNSEYKDRNFKVQPAGLAPTVMVSDLGCWRFKGTASSKVFASSGGVFRDSVWVDDLVFERTTAFPDIPYPILEFTVQGGSWHRTISQQGECHAEASASQALGGVDDWDKRLYLLAGATSGPSMRRYLGYAAANHDMPYTVHCPSDSIPTTAFDRPYFRPSFWGPPTFHVYTVAGDGTMKATEKIGPEDANMEDTWALAPEREP